MNDDGSIRCLNRTLPDEDRPMRPQASGNSTASHIIVLPYGCEVEFGPLTSPIDGFINQVSIKGVDQVVQYEVVWWAGGERKTLWLDGPEVRTATGARTHIGFKP
jgi:hypothetical protein